ncbi:MAG: GTPase [Christensenellales bacterium]
MKSGYIAIVGKANAGKSTLLNSLVGQKISIVSPKPQTTRDNITGIYTESDCQMIFVDTPGALRPSNRLGDYMVKNIEAATVDVDCVLLVLDGHDGIDESELALAEKYSPLTRRWWLLSPKPTSRAGKAFPSLKNSTLSQNQGSLAVSAKRTEAELRNGLKISRRRNHVFCRGRGDGQTSAFSRVRDTAGKNSALLRKRGAARRGHCAQQNGV